MAGIVSADRGSAAALSKGQRLFWLIGPLALLAAALAWFVTADPLQNFGNGAPPVEVLTFERTILNDAGLHLLVRAGGSQAMRITQVQVDAAYWLFSQDPPGDMARGTTAWLHLNYPWMAGEALAVTVVTNTGAVFEHEIPVTIATPDLFADQLWLLALIGALVGILPVAIGLLFTPALRGAGPAAMTFLLALTIGLLAFLLIDMSLEALEHSQAAAPLFQGPSMVWLTAAASFMALLAVGRWRGVPSGLALSFYMALGIGLHNMGEGLAIGASFAAGSAGLGTFLVVGFAIHNISEGIGIAAPILRQRVALWHFVALTMLAGAPAIAGIWFGSLAQAPQWTALALAIGAGAILQVMVEVAAYLIRSNKSGTTALISPAAVSGLLTGLAFMYATAALVKI